jgi:superfamily II DNA/RNA helicase
MHLKSLARCWRTQTFPYLQLVSPAILLQVRYLSGKRDNTSMKPKPLIEYTEEEFDLDELKRFENEDVTPSHMVPKVEIKRVAREDIDISKNAFGALHLRKELLYALSSYDINTPTDIQRLAINAILGGKSVQLSAQTGNGKTLAFLLPIINQLREEEEQGLVVRPSRPRAVVLAPSRELAMQIHSVAKSLSHHAKFRSVLLISGHGRKKQREQLAGPMDLIVATPGRLNELIGQTVFLSEVRFTVLDEADTLIDAEAGFVDLIKAIIQPIRNRGSGPDAIPHQFVLVGASFKKSSQTSLNELFPDVTPLKDAQVHMPIGHVKQTFLTVTYRHHCSSELIFCCWICLGWRQ